MGPDDGERDGGEEEQAAYERRFAELFSNFWRRSPRETVTTEPEAAEEPPIPIKP